MTSTFQTISLQTYYMYQINKRRNIKMNNNQAKIRKNIKEILNLISVLYASELITRNDKENIIKEINEALKGRSELVLTKKMVDSQTNNSRLFEELSKLI